MAKFRTIVLDTNMWSDYENDPVVIDTDKVVVAVDSGNGCTHLVMSPDGEHYILINMTFEVYSAIACEGFENTDLVAKLAT